jgi:SAM-dependent methyltransferase
MKPSIPLTDDASQPDYWRLRWVEERTGWDSGKPHPFLEDLLSMAKDGGLPNGAQILEPGTGRGHHGALLAALGYEVTSYDVSDLAISQARELYGSIPKLKFEVADAFVVQEAWRNQFVGLFDRAVLCAFPASIRAKYIETQMTYLKPGGFFMTIPFLETQVEAGPPFAMTLAEVHQLLDPYGTLAGVMEREYDEKDSKILREALMVWRKKGVLS